MSGRLGCGNPSSAFGERGVAKRIGAVSRQLAPRGERLLDVGCGDGTCTLRLARGFRYVDAVDIEPGRLAAFTERVRAAGLERRVSVRMMSGTELDFAEAAFDRITAFEAVEHIEALPRALGEIHRVLRPGGALSLTTPNRWFPFETHGVLWGERRRSPLTAPFLTWIRPLHERMSDARAFTLRELHRYLRRAGLRVHAVDYIMPPLDRRACALRRVADTLEATPLRVFGMSMAVTAVKPA